MEEQALDKAPAIKDTLSIKADISAPNGAPIISIKSEYRRTVKEDSQMEQNTETKTETKLKPEEMPEYQDKLSQSLIRGWRKQFPEWTDERIIEELEAL